MSGYSGAAGTNQGSWNGGGGGLGLTTGTQWSGNTAFGPSGGMASGYGTRDMMSLGLAGMHPQMGSYSQFNNLDGTPMFGGLLGNKQFQGMNAQQAYAQAQQAYNAMNQHISQSGLDRQTQPRPTPVSAPPIPPVKRPGLSFKYNYATPPGFSFNNYFSNPTSGPQWAGGYPGMSNSSNYNKNNQGDYGGLGNMSTAYKR